MRTLKTIQDCKDAGARAYSKCAVRLAPIGELLDFAGMPAVDAWYEGYDNAAGCGLYYGTTAQKLRDEYAASVMQANVG